MQFLGFSIAEADLQRWLELLRGFALPRALTSVGLLLGATLLFLASRWLLQRIQKYFTSRTQTDLDDLVLALVQRMALLSIGFWALWRLADIWELGRTSMLVAAVWLVALSVPVSRFVTGLLEILERQMVPGTVTQLDDTALPLINKFVQFLVIGSGVLMGLQVLGIPIAPFLGGAGIAGLAISFAAKDTLSNLIAGVLLIMDRPFQVGDRIEIWSAPKNSATWGDVTEIGLRATKIRTPDNIIIVIPNNEIMRRDIINYTASGDDIRLRIPIGIAYDADAKLAKRLALEVAAAVEGIRDHPAPVVITRSFGASAVNLEARVWVTARRRRDIGDRFTDRIKAMFDEHGVEIPFPKRDLYIKSMPMPAAPTDDAESQDA